MVMAEALPPRRGRILKHVVEEYVVTAQPVSSEIVMRKYVPNVSSATVRNEMAALEDVGYLYSPHTSAGRVPSDMGYRYYVEWLMPGARLADDEQRLISHQFHQIELDVGEWVRLAAVILSTRVQTLVMVAPPVEQVSRLRHVDFVRIGPATVLVVVVLRSGAVRQTVIRLVGDVDSGQLVKLANEWNLTLEGLTSAEIRALSLQTSYTEILDAAIHLLEDADRHTGTGTEDFRIEGLRYIASQPEFGTSDRLQPVVEALERQGVLNSLMEPLLSSQGVYVAIGQEQPLERLRDCSVVVARYGRAGEMLGVVGVIGPTRLPYWRAVPMVRYVAGMLDQLLEETFLS
jgi:heat-inducible transcriptional repressor